MKNKKASINIKGLDLKIDPAVQKICEAYNTSSSSTRSVLYILMLINVLSFIAVLNTHRGNWISSRINSKQDSILKYENEQIKLTAAHKKDSLSKNYNAEPWSRYDTSFIHKNKTLSDMINSDIIERNNLINGKIENSETVKVPIMGNSFDIDNLGFVSGISFIILLTVLRLTLRRKKNNLRLSLHAITERYTGEDRNLLILARELANEKNFSEGDVFESINLTRRKHHYNFLSMNEIFNLPFVHVSENKLRETLTGKIVVGYLFYFPCLTYLLVFLNDLSTWYEGVKVSTWHTLILYFFSYLFLTLIGLLCKACNKQKLVIDKLFIEFQRDDKYVYQPVDNDEPKLTKWKLVAYPFILLKKMFSLLWQNIPKAKHYKVYLLLSLFCTLLYVALFEISYQFADSYYMICLLPVFILYLILKAFHTKEFPIVIFGLFFALFLCLQLSKMIHVADVQYYIDRFKIILGKLIFNEIHSAVHVAICASLFLFLGILEIFKSRRSKSA